MLLFPGTTSLASLHTVRGALLTPTAFLPGSYNIRMKHQIALVEKARSMRLFVYAVDDPAISDFSYASIINIEGVMQIAISTSGKSPIMSRRVRIKAERMLRGVIKKTDIENTKLQEFARAAAKSTFKTVEQRKKFLYSLIENSRIQNLIKEDKTEDAKSTTLELLREWKKKNNR